MATGAILIGGALSAGGQIRAGQQAKKAAKRQAGFLRQQADREREAAAFDALQQDRAFEKLMGRQRLAIASSGIKLEGSSLMILEESLRDKKETIDNIIKTGGTRASGLTFQARETESAGRNALIGSILGATGTALRTGASI